MKTRSNLGHRTVIAVLAAVFLACEARTPLLEAPDGSASVGSGGTSGSTATGGTGGGGSDGTFNGCSYKLPLPEKPCIACAPLPAGDTSGCAAPDISAFNWHGGGVDTSLRYPVGCTVYLPTENPYYPGGPQSCSCGVFVGGAPTWSCPI